MVNLYSLPDGLLFKIRYSYLFLFPYQIHQVILLLQLLLLIGLLLVVIEDPYIHILALGTLDALDEIVS